MGASKIIVKILNEVMNNGGKYLIKDKSKSSERGNGVGEINRICKENGFRPILVPTGNIAGEYALRDE